MSALAMGDEVWPEFLPLSDNTLPFIVSCSINQFVFIKSVILLPQYQAKHGPTWRIISVTAC